MIYKQLEHFVAQWICLRIEITVNCCIVSCVRASEPIRKASMILCNLLWTVCSVAVTSQSLIKTINQTMKADNREKSNKQRTLTIHHNVLILIPHTECIASREAAQESLLSLVIFVLEYIYWTTGYSAVYVHKHRKYRKYYKMHVAIFINKMPQYYSIYCLGENRNLAIFSFIY